MAVETQTDSLEESASELDDWENDVTDPTTIFNPQDPNNGDNNFPTVNSDETQTVRSYNEMEDEATKEILRQCLNNDIIIGELLQHYSDSFKDKQNQKRKLKKQFFFC